METKTWTSKESDYNVTITLKQVGSSKIAELDYISELDNISMQYKASKEKVERKLLKEQYRLLASRLNSQTKQPLHNETL